MTLTAAGRSCLRSTASKTRPMPPWPMSPTSLKRFAMTSPRPSPRFIALAYRNATASTWRSRDHGLELFGLFEAFHHLLGEAAGIVGLGDHELRPTDAQAVAGAQHGAPHDARVVDPRAVQRSVVVDEQDGVDGFERRVLARHLRVVEPQPAGHGPADAQLTADREDAAGVRPRYRPQAHCPTPLVTSDVRGSVLRSPGRCESSSLEVALRDDARQQRALDEAGALPGLGQVLAAELL